MNQRTFAIDCLRGFIIVLMALDHASGMVARVHFSEVWGSNFEPYPDLAWWFTRFVSHLCAPGFFLLMGMSMVLFAQKRAKNGWTIGTIRKYFVKRGGFILLLMFLLELPAWALGMGFSTVEQHATPFPGVYEGGFMIPTTVLYGLGACMIVGSLLWQLQKVYLLLITIISFACSTWLINQLSPHEAFGTLWGFLCIPGHSTYGLVLYPVVPWIGITTFGMFWAKLLVQVPKQVYHWALAVGVSFIVAFLGIRLLGVGNFHMQATHTWIDFFTLVKYPPSIAFALITLGINLVLFYMFARWGMAKLLYPLRVFGQTAMFFYITHLYVYALIGIAFPKGAAIEIMYVLWLLALIPLYMACKRFIVFKRKQAVNSLWRMV